MPVHDEIEKDLLSKIKIIIKNVENETTCRGEVIYYPCTENVKDCMPEPDINRIKMIFN